ncbi:hypothetical protein [Furfurilactobacillus entadae]|uniref:hypothetical protein n=1 Tax=Furfurilactobacillus entadae TaxID=2922307 RepID=UPI0035EBB3F6
MAKHKRPAPVSNDNLEALKKLKKLREKKLMLRIENAYLKIDALDREEEAREKSHKTAHN